MYEHEKREIYMAYLLGIDIGTSGTKTVLFSEFGNAIVSDTIEYPLYQLQNVYAEHQKNMKK